MVVKHLEGETHEDITLDPTIGPNKAFLIIRFGKTPKKLY